MNGLFHRASHSATFDRPKPVGDVQHVIGSGDHHSQLRDACLVPECCVRDVNVDDEATPLRVRSAYLSRLTNLCKYLSSTDRLVYTLHGLDSTAEKDSLFGVSTKIRSLHWDMSL